MSESLSGSVRARLTAPQAAGIAGILFALLFATSLVLMRIALGASAQTTATWSGPESGQIRVAMALMPYAGIAFLWFIGVVRDRLGDLEDKFFSTIFLGSGLILIAMMFAASAIAGGILAAAQLNAEAAYEVTVFARTEMLEITNVYALRMAGVFMVSLGTLWLRTGLMKLWTILLTYALALVLLLMINLSLWIQLVFPAWTLLISILFLIKRARTSAAPPSEGRQRGTASS